MGDSHSQKPDRGDQPDDAQQDELAFGGEPAEIAAPSLSWLVASDQPTQISKTPPLVPPHIEPMRPAEFARTLVGGKLEHFELKEMVGGGGMGAVFRATDTRLNRTVAIKVLPRDQANDDEVVRRFRNEAQSAARLDHDNVARVYYVGEDKGLHFIAFEFIEGKNLRDVVAQHGRLPVADALSYTLQLADALSHAAERDVVHRDIKPSNVIIGSDGRAKLVDMGLARLHQIDKSSEDLTASGVTLGTFDYISPEQARDPRSADPRSDIYSLGCTLFFMLTGRPPFPDGTVLQKLLQHQADDIPDPREFNQEIPLELVRILRRMMAKDPRQRHQSPDELVGELALLANQWGIRTTGGEGLLVASQPGEPSFLERHIVWMLPVAALLLIFVFLRLSASVDASSLLSWLQPANQNAPAAGQMADIEDPTSIQPRAQQSAPPRVVIRSSDASTSAPQESRDAIAPSPGTAQRNVPDANPISGIIDPVESDRAPVTFDAQEDFEHRASVDGQVSTFSASATDALDFATTRASVTDIAESLDLVEAAADTPTATPGVLVVSQIESGEGVFPTLHAACMAAEIDDVIELRYHGRQDEPAIDLRNKRLTIRAGQGFKPVFVFRPQEVDPRTAARSMISLAGGRLMLVNVALEFDLPVELPADDWSLFRLQQAESLQLERCSLTVRNVARLGGVFHDDVAVFRVVAPPGGNSMLTPDESGEPVVVQLRDCLVRGEADLLVQQDAQPCQLNWANGVLAISGHMLVSESARRMPPPRDRLRVDLTHLTIDAREGLCRLSNTIDAPYQIATEIRVSNSILLGGDTVPMIFQSGVDTVDELRSRFKWDGTRNFYDGFKTYWRIQGRDARDEPQLAEAPGWMSFLRGEKMRGPVVWRALPDEDRPLHSLLPDDYALDEGAANNSAVKGASDGRNAGCDFSSLPQMPAGDGMSSLGGNAWQPGR